MNLEVLSIVPKKLITNPEILGRVCWNLSNRLTGNRWIYDEVREAELTRSVSELMGIQHRIGDTAIAPAANDVHAAFYARKNMVEGLRDNYADIDEYRLTMTIGQTIEQDDMPPYVLDEIFDGVDDDNIELGSVLETIERDTLDECEIMREQTIEYNVTGGGQIQDYSLTYAYLFDDEEVHETYYSSEEDLPITTPMRLPGSDEVVDERPVVLALLNQFNIESEIKEIDASWASFMEHTTMRELVAFGGQSQLDHRQQALAIIGLLTSGMYGLRSLASRS